jgi:hypothetical protein
MNERIMRPCDVFLRSQGHLLGEHGFVADPGCVQYTVNEEILLYHYTRSEHLNKVLMDGLQARLPIVLADENPNLRNRYLVEAFLEPLPQWLTNSPYFGNLGLEFMQAYVGNILLEITLPLVVGLDVYVADAAHSFECKHQNRRGRSVLRLGYDCRSGQEVCQAEVNSYIPVSSYRGGHIAPNVKITRQGAGIAVLPQYIAICDRQPLV